MNANPTFTAAQLETLIASESNGLRRTALLAQHAELLRLEASRRVDAELKAKAQRRHTWSTVAGIALPLIGFTLARIGFAIAFGY